MANVIFPILSVYLTVGGTINIKTYSFGRPALPIYNETDVVETPLNSFNATYYVLPDENVPGEKFRVPIDFLLRAKSEGAMSAKKDMIHGYTILSSRYRGHNALILVVTEYQTSEQTVKANANPTPDWQNNIWTSVPQTHYVEKIVYGYQAISLISVRSLMAGDIQVFRRILRDVMGTSGRVTADTVELWKKAERTIRESPDVRGEVFIGASSDSTTRYSVLSGSVEHLLEYVSEFPKNVENSVDDVYIKTPLYVSCRPLHDVDEQYPIVRKDVESEGNFVKMYHLLRDVEETDLELKGILRLISRENREKMKDFQTMLRNVHRTLRRAYSKNLSLYENVNKTAIQIALDEYQEGLDNTTESYFALFSKLREKIATGITCGEDFFPPTRGVLRVDENEVFQKGKVEDFEICKYFCVEDELCRAVGYSENECLVYYRSTNSATITLPDGDSEDMKIYDRKCRFIFDD